MLQNNQTQLLQTIRTLVAKHPFASKGVLDIDTDGDGDTDGETLVVLTDTTSDRLIIDITVRTLWSGPVEIYCATDLMAFEEELVSHQSNAA